MSLQLRKACQQQLDAVGLDNYHIQVNRETKYLEIVGECGQTLVSISGIQLSRVAPNNSEMKLALELFDSFLAKHTGTFKEFITAKTRADAANIPKKVKGLKNAKVEKQTYYDRWDLTFTPECMPAESVTVSSNGVVSFPSRTVSYNSPKDWRTVNAGLTVAETEHITEWILECIEFTAATKEKKKALEILSSCEI
jgi:hypothetical protein